MVLIGRPLSEEEHEKEAALTMNWRDGGTRAICAAYTCFVLKLHPLAHLTNTVNGSGSNGWWVWLTCYHTPSSESVLQLTSSHHHHRYHHRCCRDYFFFLHVRHWIFLGDKKRTNKKKQQHKTDQRCCMVFGEHGEENRRWRDPWDVRMVKLSHCASKPKTASNQQTYTTSQGLIITCMESPNQVVYTHLSVIIFSSNFQH